MAILSAYLLPHQASMLLKQKSGAYEKTLLSYKEVGEQIARLKPDTIIVVSPHMESYRDYVQIADGEVGTGTMSYSSRGEYKFRFLYDRQLAREIASVCSVNSFPAGMEEEKDGYLDHGTMVPLFFINRAYPSYKIVRVGVSGLSLFDHYRLGEMISKAVDSLGRKAIVIASGDLSHAHEEDGKTEYAKKFDVSLQGSVSKGNFGALLNFSRKQLRAASECSVRPLLVMAGCFDRHAVASTVLSRQTVDGVGVMVASFSPRGVDQSRAFLDHYLAKETMTSASKRSGADAYAKLAYRAIEYHLENGGRLPVPSGLPPAFNRKGNGLFVSLFKHGMPRGCVGTVFAREGDLANEIISNALACALSDPRYGEVTNEEWPYITLEVAVCSRPERIQSSSELDPSKYGIIVESGKDIGVLLPGLEGISTREEQLAIALKKARIEKGQAYSLFRFTVTRHH